MAKRALIVGIDNYDNALQLGACVADAREIEHRLRTNVDSSPNYDCKLVVAEAPDRITRAQLRSLLRELFDAFPGETLLYFSGHGSLTATGGALVTSDAEDDDVGIPMNEIVDLANASKASDVLMLFDCCHAGAAGNNSMQTASGMAFAQLRENATVIAASRAAEAAVEAGGHGLFTAAVMDALDGGAADHMGWVTAASIYSYVERRFGAWAQRPVYKSHTTQLKVVRECAPLIDRLKLRDLVTTFPTVDHKLQLDPAFEPEDEFGNTSGAVDARKVSLANLLKEYRDAGLVRPTLQGEQLFWTARRSHTVELTQRGREYWTLVVGGRI